MTAIIASGNATTRPYRVDISRGTNNSRVSSEWFSRPQDERYLSLGDLYESVRTSADRATTRIVESRSIRVEARSDDRCIRIVISGVIWLEIIVGEQTQRLGG